MIVGRDTISNVARNLLAICGGCLFTVIIYFLVSTLYTPRGKTLDREFKIVDQKTQRTRSITVPFYKRLKSRTSMTLETKVSLTENMSLVMPRVSANSIELLFDNRIIDQIGTLSKTANIFPHFHILNLNALPTHEEVTIQIRISGILSLGIRELPYLIDITKNSLFVNFAQFILVHSYWLSLCGCIFLAILLVLFAKNSSWLRYPFILMAAGDFCAAMFILEFIPLESRGDLKSYLLLKKFTVFGAYFTSCLTLAAVEKLVKKRIRLGFVMIAISGICTLVIFFQSDFYSLTSVFDLTGGIVLFNWVFLLIFILMESNKILIFFWSCFVSTVLFSSINFLLFHGHILLYNVAILLAQSVASVQLVFSHKVTRKKLDDASAKSITDSLTGALNRYALENIKLNSGDVLVLIDLNDFKEINDTHGHKAGDQVLIELVRAMKRCTRGDDRIIRMGGDEFVIYFQSIDNMSIEGILTRIQVHFKKNLNYEVSFSYGIVRCRHEQSIEKALEKADQRLYEMKRL